MHRLLKILFLAILLLSSPIIVFAIPQSDEMAKIERVSELLDELNSQQISKRDAAEEELIAIGPFALEHLDDASDDMPLDKIERLARVRATLETMAVRAASQPSTVMLDGSLSVEQSLKRVKQQTQNDIAISENSPVAAGQAMICLLYTSPSPRDRG